MGLWWLMVGDLGMFLLVLGEYDGFSLFNLNGRFLIVCSSIFQDFFEMTSLN
jgi:hypothetical protein